MKTQLLYLDPHDDTASTREKLRWVQADRVVLVWPSHGRVLQRRVDLILLKREAARQAAQLGVLSHDPDVRAHARDLDLPLFDDLDTIPPEAWPAPATSPEAFPSRLAPGTALQIRPARPTQAARRRWDDARRAGWMLVVILALLALSVVVGPAAVIELTPESRLSLAGMQVVFAAEPPPQEGTVWIPARRLRVEVQGELRLPTEGTVPADVATAGRGRLRASRQAASLTLRRGAPRLTAMNRFCVFCEIIAGREAADILYQDDEVVVFRNRLRWAPVMLLSAPTKHLTQAELWTNLGRVGEKAVEMGEKHCPGGYRLVSNFGRDAMQSQDHAHVHVIGGTFLGEYA